MSRKVLRPRTGSRVLGPSRPIEVPSPPLSLMIAVRARASRATSGSMSTDASLGGSVRGSIESSRM
jgi:hypothetical protein